MTPAGLLHELEPLSHDERMRRMVGVGRRAATDSTVAATLAALAQGDFYARWLALQSCYGSADGAHVLRALGDPSRTIRGCAARLVAVACDDAQAHAALAAAPRSLRRTMLRHLVKRRRRAPIDTFLGRLAADDPDELTQLAPFGSTDLVRRLPEAAFARGAAEDWRRLARHHPVLATAALRRRAEAAGDLDPRLVWQANAALPLLAQRCPDDAAHLVQALRYQVPLAQLDLQALVGRRPEALADLLLATDEPARVDLSRVAHRLDVDRLRALVERHGGTVRDRERWFARLPPAQRNTLYTAFGRGWRDGDGALPQRLVALLPRQPREAEGRRHLALPALATQPTRRLRFAAFIPWDEAREVLDQYVRNPDPDLRATAMSVLADGVRYARERLPDLLAMVRARRNEQDPVRHAMVAGLAGLPPGIWNAEHLDDLGQVIREALDAADLSAGTAGAAEHLVLRLLPLHPEWAAGWLATLVRERGQLYANDLDRSLAGPDVHRVAPFLLPVLRSWETRERVWQITAVAWSFGRRLCVFNGLVDILERLVHDWPAPQVSERALQIIARYQRDRLAALVPDLIRRDQSWATRPVVLDYLHRRRQDLLSPFLGRAAYRGRFSTGRTYFVLPLMDGFHRWTPTQQATFAQTLRGVTGDEARDTPALFLAIAQLAALPAVPPTQLVELASAQNPKPMVRDQALRALGTLDAGSGVPALLEALDDDRARIAIYALRRAVLEMPPDRALELLRGVPVDKVTVAKEVARLLGDIRSEAAYRELLAWDARDLHRDVRIAVLRGLWPHVERDETWPSLARAAASPDAALATAVGRIPANRLSPAAQRRLAALLAALLAHPDPAVRLDALRRCAQLPVVDDERVLLAPLLAALGAPLPGESTAAADAVFATYAGRDAPLVGEVVGRLIPNRRALRTAVEALQATLPWQRRHLLPTVRAVLTALTADPLTASLQVTLAAMALPAEELAALLARLATAGALHADAQAAAVQAIALGATGMDQAGRARLEAGLATAGDARLRRLALAALVAQAAPPHGWDDARLSRLRAYRADPAPLVAAAAQFTLPTEEVTTTTEIE